MTKPEPRPACRCGPRGIGPPKNLSQNWPNGSPSPKGAGACSAVLRTCVVEMLTTAGPSFFARLAKSGNAAAATVFAPDSATPAWALRMAELYQSARPPAPASAQNKPTANAEYKFIVLRIGVPISIVRNSWPSMDPTDRL